MRRAIGVGAALLALALSPGLASAAVPEGPRLAYGQWGPGAYSLSLLSVDPFAGNPLAIYRGHRRVRPVPSPFGQISWFPDGRALAFAGLTGSLSGRGPGTSKVFVVSAEGGRPWPVAGTEGAIEPVVSPDGGEVAFALIRERTRITRQSGKRRQRVERAISTWIVDLAGGSPRRLTPWRYGLEGIPSSFSPDGRTLAVSRVRGRRDSDVLALEVETGGSTVLVPRASSAAFSPDGGSVAYLKVGPNYRERLRDGFASAPTIDLFVKRLDGSRVDRLTRSPKKLEVSLTWDPSGQRLAFVQHGTIRNFLRAFGAGSAIDQINADGTCRTNVISWPDAALFGTAWQPGPGREAGRIAC